MTENDLKLGCGSLFLAVVFSVGYLVYDGYVERGIPLGEREKLTTSSRLYASGEIDVGLLVVNATYSGDWDITDMTVDITFYNGEELLYGTTVHLNNKGRNTFLSKNRKEKVFTFLVPNINAPEKKVLTKSKHDNTYKDFDKWLWHFNKVEGNRAPINLISKPVLFFNSLFKRDFDHREPLS